MDNPYWFWDQETPETGGRRGREREYKCFTNISVFSCTDQKVTSRTDGIDNCIAVLLISISNWEHIPYPHPTLPQVISCMSCYRLYEAWMFLLFSEKDDGNFEYFLQCADVIKPLLHDIYKAVHEKVPPFTLEQHQHLYVWTSSPQVQVFDISSNTTTLYR